MKFFKMKKGASPCDNPVQLIGLYAPEKSRVRPYGRHCGKDVPIGTHNERNYRYCPYASHVYETDRNAGKPELTDFERDIYHIARDNFDIAVKIIQEDTGICVSKRLAGQLLDNYVASRGHMYYHATPDNIPWMFLYFLDTGSITNYIIRKDSDLYQYLSGRDDVVLLPSSYIRGYYVVRGNGRYPDQLLLFKHHNRIVTQDGYLSESIRTVLMKEQQVGTTGREYRKKIEISGVRFMNRVASEKTQEYRDPVLLALAKERMPDI